MWLICIEVQWLSFGVKVVGYMIEAGYVIDEYQARAERRYVVRILPLVIFLKKRDVLVQRGTCSKIKKLLF